MSTPSSPPFADSVRLLALAFGLIGVLLAPGAVPFAQEQPSEALNHQDEQINLNKAVDVDTSKFTIFRSGDKAEINNYISEVVELKHAAAYEILPHVLKAVKREKGDARTLKYKDPETGKTRYFMQVVTTRDQMPSVIETIRTIDLEGVTSSQGDMYYHYRMKYRQASEVASIIGATTLSGEGEIFADDVTNTVFFKDSQSDGERSALTMKFYDVPPPQVEFDVLAAEIEEDDAAKLGLDWDSWKRALGGQFDLTGNRFEGGEGFARLDALLTVDASALASFLNYTAQEGHARVVTRTRLTASNDRPGIVSSLRHVPAFDYEVVRPTVVPGPGTLSEETPGLFPSTTGNFRDTVGERPVVIVPPTSSYLRNRGDSLAPGASALDPSTLTGPKSEGIYVVIQPTIGTDMVTANIRLVVNSLSGYTKLDEPILSERLLDTEVTLKNGEPLSLGGIDKETTAEVRRGIPGLKNIPVLKYLFSVNGEVRRRSKVFLVLTPAFRNQVIFNSPVLLSYSAEKEPMVEVNTSLPAPAMPETESQSGTTD